ncbi:MAG: protein kinase [Deltaproteobacteria bacterium]|nr:protein kinase [Deltaproteobacteria bacterium]NND29771.1 protein kinase [Myxococcales bacterium]MBT8465555.1 protein kinase [Deltaproteobacteria bacterium]MBT8480145.1 protein kinase [Deltaproteobacteria bacterium]NNK07036.1 protein kinase [Myxococcales bacterium]
MGSQGTVPFLLNQLRPLGKGGAAFTQAAASIALTNGQPQTIVDVLHGRAFRYYAEGLRQYLAIRTGSTERADQCLAKLRAYVAKTESNELLQPPGVRARLYRAARGYMHNQSRPHQPPSKEKLEELPWRALPSAHHSTSPLNGLRFDLSTEDSELLELRHARELSIEELAFVYGQSADVIQERVNAAMAQAERILTAHGVSDASRFGRVIIEAFALEPAPRPPGEGDETVEPLSNGTIVGGRYSIEARVGLGAFGDVYRAKDTEVPGHVVALKMLHQPAHSKSAKQSALRELRLIASVFHPSIVQFKDHGWFEERLWFVMPWYDGETLQSRLQREPLNRAEALSIFQPLARALAAMHAAGVRHQDVKPENIFLARIPGFGTEEVTPVLLDLGVAATEAEMVVAGTPTYFAPEVAAQFASVESKPVVSNKADVFALALSLRNALEPETQEDVAAGAVDTFIENRSKETPHGPNRKGLNYLAPFFNRWLSLNAEERPTAEELASELSALSLPEERRERLKTILRWTIPMALALLGASGAAVTVFYQQAETQREVAQQAKLTASDLRRDLADTREIAEQLELRYEQSRLTRTELAKRLARTDGHVASLKTQLKDEERRVVRTREKLAQNRQEKATIEQHLSETERDLSAAERSLAGAKQRLAATKQELSAEQERAVRIQRRLEREGERRLELQGEIAALDARLNAELSKSQDLQDSVARAVAARSRAELELEFAEEELKALRERSAPRAAEPDPDAFMPSERSPGS